MPFTPEQCIERYMEMREAKKTIDARSKEIAKGMKAIEDYLFGVMVERKEIQIKTKFGVAYQIGRTRVTLADREALNDNVRHTGNFNIFTNEVRKEEVISYFNENKVPPPGVEITNSIECNIRKA